MENTYQSDCTDCGGSNPCPECKETQLVREIEMATAEARSYESDPTSVVMPAIEVELEESIMMQEDVATNDTPAQVTATLDPEVVEMIMRNNQPTMTHRDLVKPDNDPTLKSTEEEKPLTSKWWFWLILVVVLVLLVIGAVKLFKK